MKKPDKKKTTTRMGYVRLICEAMVSEHGVDLCEHDTDLRMARAVVVRLQHFLDFEPENLATKTAFNEWRKGFQASRSLLEAAIP